MRHIFNFFVLVVFLGMVSAWSNASDIAVHRYKVYEADLNNDGRQDYYFEGKQLVVPIHGDIITPILLSPPQSFVIYSDHDIFLEPTHIEFTATEMVSYNLQVSSATISDLESIYAISIMEPFEKQAALNFNYSLKSPTPSQLPNSQFVAITQGSANVNNGSATYSVNIELPPAVKNLKPNLSINYSSHSGNGFLGVGWSLGGFSSISRCRTTFASEGAQAQDSNPRYTVSDRLCMDGRKLEVRSSTAPADDATYWANGTEYRTSIDNFSKILAYGASSSGGHSYFKVWTKDGKVLTYGESSVSQDSKIYAPGQPNGPVKVWALDTVEDAYGNTYTISYTTNTSTGEYYPDRVNFSPDAAVVFTYKDREGQIPWGFDMGNKYEHTKLLDEIVTYINVTEPSNPAAGTPVRKYRINYQVSSSTNRERIREITECGYNNESWLCAKPLTFSWQDGEFGFDNASPQTLTYCSGGQITDALQSIDLDADGYSDIIHQSGKISWGGTTQCFTDGAWVIEGASHIKSAQPIRTKLGYALLVKQVNTTTSPDQHILGIIKNINQLNQTSTYVQIRLDTSDTNQAIVGDFNNDGLDDFIYGGIYYQQNYTTSASFTSRSAPAFTDRGGFSLTDLDGDGLKDLLSTKVSSTSGATLLGSKTRSGGSNEPAKFFGAFEFLANEVQPYVVASDYFGNPIKVAGGMYRTLIDTNGDGLKDYLYHRVGEGGAPANTGGWFYRLNKQDGSVSSEVYTAIIAAKSNEGIFVFNHYSFSYDYDKDGREDLVAIIPEGVDKCRFRVLLSRYVNGNLAFEEALDANGNRVVLDKGIRTSSDPTTPIVEGCTPIYQDGMNLPFGDINNDGIADYYHKGTVRYGKPEQPDLLTTITNGFGAEVKFEYSTLSKTYNNGKPLYTPDSVKPSFPQAPVNRGMQVVKKMAISNGQGGLINTFYNYIGGKVDIQGRGFLGFSKIETTNTSTGVVTIRNYLQSYPYVGRVSNEVTKTSAGMLISRVDNYYDIHSINSRFPYLSYSINRVYELLTSSEAEPVSVTKSQTTYDSCGNPLTRTTTVGSSLTGTTVSGILHTETISNTLLNGSDDDCANDFVEENEVTMAGPNGANARSVTTTFEPNDQYETYTRTDFSGTNVSATTTVERDNHGNITSTSTIADDIDNTTTSARATTFENFEKNYYPTTIKNAKNHASTVEYDYRFGAIKRETDPNGLVSSRTFDVLGRSIREVAADGTVTDLLSYYCTSSPVSCPANAVYLVATRITNPNEPGKLGAPLTITFYDSLQREIRQQVYSVDGTVVKTDTQYMSNGRLHRVSEPYTSTAAHWTTYSNYDALGRAKTVLGPDLGTLSKSFSRYGTTIRTTETLTVVTPNGNQAQTTTSYTNPLGQIVKVDDANLTPIFYSYDAQGHLETTSFRLSVPTTITLVHDVAGNKTRITDPDAGTIDFAYNGFGELRKQTWQMGVSGHEKSITYTYDQLGRTISRVDEPVSGSAVSYSWVWDTLQSGQLTSRSGNGFTETYGYDGFSRMSTQTTTLSGLSGSRVFSYGYDRFSRPTTTTYPTGLKINRDYHAAGLHVRTQDITNGNNKVIWALGKNIDERGQLTQQLFGNGIVTQAAYRDDNGRLENITSGRLSAANTISALHGDIQNLSYEFDSIGNLYSRSTQRTSNNGTALENISESFNYDSLNRVTSSSTTGLFNRIKDYDYDDLGNLTSHTDIGALRYDRINGAGVHAVTSSGTSGTPTYKTYHYDKYGNMTQRGGESITYDVFNKPLTISGSSGTSTFTYGPDHERYKQVSGGKTTYIIGGGMYEEIVSGSTVTKKSYVDGFLVYAQTGSTTEVTYLHSDHLGSIEAMTDANGNLSSRMSFDVWGNRQKSDWRSGVPTELGTYKTSMGYTGHEQLDTHNLIHMGGRVYDPTIGRFLSADLFVHSAHDTQSFNRYSYVRNNPLSATDPTGYDECSPAADACHYPTRPRDYHWDEGIDDQRYRENMDQYRFFENPGPQDWHIDLSGIMIDLNSFTGEEVDQLIEDHRSERQSNSNWERSDRLFTAGSLNGRGLGLDATTKAAMEFDAFNARHPFGTRFSQQEAEVGATIMAHRENVEDLGMVLGGLMAAPFVVEGGLILGASRMLTLTGSSIRPWKEIAKTPAGQAVNKAMSQFGSGPEGARKLLQQVQSGRVRAPQGATREALQSYRNAVQENLNTLSKTGRTESNPNFPVMEARLKIYDIWLK